MLKRPVVPPKLATFNKPNAKPQRLFSEEFYQPLIINNGPARSDTSISHSNSFHDSSYPDSLQDQIPQMQLEDPSRSDQAQQALDDELVKMNTQSSSQPPSDHGPVTYEWASPSDYKMPSRYLNDPMSTPLHDIARALLSWPRGNKPIAQQSTSENDLAYYLRDDDAQSREWHNNALVNKTDKHSEPNAMSLFHHPSPAANQSSAELYLSRAVSSNLAASDSAQLWSRTARSPQEYSEAFIKSIKNMPRGAPPWGRFNMRDHYQSLDLAAEDVNTSDDGENGSTDSFKKQQEKSLQSPNSHRNTYFVQNATDPDETRLEDRYHNPIGVLVCDKCSSSFRGQYRVGSLARHVRAKHSESRASYKGYDCKAAGCGKIFRRQDALLNHQRTKHQYVSPPRAPRILNIPNLASSKASFIQPSMSPPLRPTPSVATTNAYTRTSQDLKEAENETAEHEPPKIDHVEQGRYFLQETVPMGYEDKIAKSHTRSSTNEVLAEESIQSHRDITELRRRKNNGERMEDMKSEDAYLFDTAGVEDDNMSASSSYCNSVFSIQYLSSSASDLSDGSGYSAGQIATATRELVLIFQEDELLVPLYKTAFECPSIGPERLQRNLRRLFKQYAEHLEGEAIDRLQYLASRLVLIKAKYLAESIIEKFQGIAAPKSVQRDSSDEEEENGSVYDGNFKDLVGFREFLVASDAFDTFRTHVQQFVMHPTLRPLKPEETVYERVSSATPLMDKKDEVQTNCEGRLNMLGRTLDQLLIAAGQLEPPLQQGRSRLRWKCGCGKRFFGDVTELQKNGIAKLVSRMERSSGVKLLTSSSSPGNDVQRYSFQFPVRLLQAAIGKITSSLRTKTDTSALPQHNSSNSTATCPIPSGTPAQQQTLHLMACMHKGKYRKELYQDRVETIRNDRKLFTFLEEQYTRHKGRFKNIVSLKNIQGIFFVKFHLPMGDSVEIRHHDPCCINTVNTPCSCIPPPPKVEPSPSAEYRCIPGPPETYPPVMSEQLMHMLNSPSCIDETETWILDLLPKRTCGELRGKAGQPIEGWGIYYKEGWDRDMIAFMIFAVFLLGSLLFGVLWSKFKMDVQAAFGVSAYMGTACGIFVAVIAMRAER